MGIFKLILLEYSYFTTVVLVSTVQQSESGKYIHMSPLFWISFPFRSSQSTEKSSLSYTVSSYCYLFHIYVYVCESQSPNSFHPPPSPLESTHVFSTFVFCICSLFLLCK